MPAPCLQHQRKRAVVANECRRSLYSKKSFFNFHVVLVNARYILTKAPLKFEKICVERVRLIVASKKPVALRDQTFPAAPRVGVQSDAWAIGFYAACKFCCLESSRDKCLNIGLSQDCLFFINRNNDSNSY